MANVTTLQSPFDVHVSTDPIGAGSMDEFTHLDMTGGYIGANAGAGYNTTEGITFSSPNVPIMNQISNWIQNNPIMAGVIGIGLIMFLKGGRR